MEIYDYTVEKEESGIRIDRYLAEKDSGLSRSFIQKLLKDGQITVGDKAAKSNYKVRENDRIHLEIPDSSEPDIVPEDIPLDIKVAVMGCVVTGAGEAKEADIGIAGGVGEGLLI